METLQAIITAVLVGLVSWAMTSHFTLAKKADTLDKVQAAIQNPDNAGAELTVKFPDDTWHSLVPQPVEVRPLAPWWATPRAAHLTNSRSL